MIKSKLLKKFPELIHGISEKRDGNMKIWPGAVEEVLKNRKRFCRQANFPPKELVVANLSHSNKIKIVNEVGRIKETGDGLITNQPNIFLAITVADCVPVLFYAPLEKVCGIVHAGWRGTVKNICSQFLKIGKKEFAIQPSDWRVFIGPAIGQCHYQVDKKLFQKFKKSVQREQDTKYFIDLKIANKEQLIQAGVGQKNIEISKDCTYCLKNKYFSYRREKNKNFSAMLAVIGIKN